MLRSLTAALLLALAAAPAGAQVPSPAQVQQALQQPSGLGDVLRARIRESGLTPQQIRARLQASGYPGNLLDAYLGGAAGGGSPAPGQMELNAIQALGLPPITSEIVSPDTGMVRMVGGPRSRVFGVDVFRRTTTQFLPVLSGPVPADYKLGPGDVLVLILTGDVELAYTLQVTREGFMLIPQVGQVFVSNLTLDQLRDVLYSRLGRVYSGVRRSNPTTRFDLSVANVRVNQVYVVGEVAQPGAYQLSSLGTVLTALYAAGGLLETANTREIQVQRTGKVVSTFDLYQYLLQGDTRNDIRLETGDVVFVGVHGVQVDVAGAVVRPGIYEIRGNESLRDLLRAAGGFRPEASFRKVTVRRILPAGERVTEAVARVAIEVPLLPGGGRREGGSAPGGMTAANGVVIPPFRLEDGDAVVVDSLPTWPNAYFVAVAGRVRAPGTYPWHEGMTLRELLRLARGPAVGADLREAEIARLPDDRSEGQLATTMRVRLDSSYLLERDSAGRYVGVPGVAFPRPGSAPDVPLRPFDNVLIFRQPEFEMQRTVTITGEVQYPGAYALKAKSERLADLVKRAGGLTAQAYPQGVQFHRSLGETGRINVDLERALRSARARDNVILQPGDSVHVPEFQPSVKVSGAVNSPGAVLYRPGAGLDYYLSAAGGFSQQADKRHVAVRLANGEVRTKAKWLIFTNSPKPEPGSEVLVPTEDPAHKTNYVAVFGSMAQILASMVAIIAVATR